DLQASDSSTTIRGNDLYHSNLSNETRFTFIWTTFNWTVIIFNSLVFLNFLPNYAHLYGRLLRISNYGQYVLNASAFFVLFECLWLAAFRGHHDGRNAALDLVCHYSKVIDSELSLFLRLGLVRWFSRRFAWSRIYFKYYFLVMGLQM